MADCSVRRIADIHPGDLIYGTAREGWYRRYVKSRVLAHWSVIKPAYRIALEDGTELIAGPDHRFLTERGWKFVTGTEQGQARRPHLTTGNKMMGVGAFAHAPVKSEDYRLGYLCGVIRGDGHLASHRFRRGNGAIGTLHQFRLALCDVEALLRVQDYLRVIREHVGANLFDFVLVNSNNAYAPTGGQAPVIFRPADTARHPEVRFIASDVVNVRKPSHHDPDKLARTIMRKVWQA